MKTMRSACVTATVCTAAACVSCGSEEAAPRPQWLVEVSTDAPVPELGDRLLVEVLTEQGELACTSCRREAVLADVKKWPATFGIEATDGGVVVRARLYRSDHVGSTGQPEPATTIDRIGRLPLAGGGVTAVGIRLQLACIGTPPTDVQHTCIDGAADQPVEPLAGPLGQNGELSDLFTRIHRDCTDVAGESGMVCVAGGLFFLGDSLAPAPHSDVAAAASPERLFGVDTFLLDEHEVTVAEFHQFVLATMDQPAGECPQVLEPGRTKDLICRMPNESSTSQKLFCTYTVDDPLHPPESDDRAINCVSKWLADQYCQSQGKRLPAEVEWEFAAANGMRETRYPWDNRPPSCDLAWLSRAATSPIDDPYVQCQASSDDTATPDGLAVASINDVGMGADRACPREYGESEGTACPGWISGLAGNVSEWTSDYFMSYGSSDDPGCWVPHGPIQYLRDRIEAEPWAWCQPSPLKPQKYNEYTVRGGNWRESLDSAWSANRAHATEPAIIPRPDVGFRCAKSVP